MSMIFLGPMANTLSKKVKDAMVNEDICHREPEFESLLKEVKTKLLKLVKANDSYCVVAFTGSGSAAMESAISSIPKDAKLAVMNNGAYSDRLVLMAKSYGLNITELNFGDNYPTLGEVEKTITSGISHFAMVHHETVSGILNPLEKIADLCKQNNVKLIVDAISSVGAHELDVVKSNISYLMISSNKGIQGPEGASFVIAKKNDIPKESRNFYLSLAMNYEFQEIKGQCPFTPAVRVFQGTNAALNELNDETLPKRISRYKALQGKIRSGLEELGFKNHVTLEQRSNNVSTFYWPDNKDYEKVYLELKRRGYLIYGGKPFNGKKTFRICTFGNIHNGDIEKFLIEFKAIISV